MNRLSILLFLLVACVFLPTLRNGFVVYDDIAYIHENPLVTSPNTKAALLTAWLKPYEQNYTPLLWTSFRLIHGLFETNPIAYHLPSILLHAANAVLLFHLLLKLRASIQVAFIASALWAIHPQRVEAVSWASAFKDPASTFFALCFTWLWLEARRHPTKWKWWIASATALAISLLFKQAAMTLPFVLFAYHLLVRDKETPLLLRQNIPLMFLGFTAACLAAWANHDAFTHATYLNFQSIWDQPIHALAALAFTLGKTFLPAGMILDYPVPEKIGVWAILGFTLLMLWALILIRCIMQKDHPRIFCLLWSAGLWLPASGIVPTPLEFTADRLTYLPGAMFTAFIILSLERHFSQRTLTIAATAILIPLGILSVRQQAHWRSSDSLIEHSLRVSERHYPSILNDAVLRLQRGENPDGPIRSLEAAVGFYPYRSAAYHRLVQIHRIIGNTAEAEEWITRWRQHCEYDPEAFAKF